MVRVCRSIPSLEFLTVSWRCKIRVSIFIFPAKFKEPDPATTMLTCSRSCLLIGLPASTPTSTPTPVYASHRSQSLFLKHYITPMLKTVQWLLISLRRNSHILTLPLWPTLPMAPSLTSSPTTSPRPTPLQCRGEIPFPLS